MKRGRAVVWGAAGCVLVLAIGGTLLAVNRSAATDADPAAATALSTPAPPTPGPLTEWPGEANTGVPAGTSLTAYSENCTITSPVTLNAVDALACGAIVIKSKDVVITNSLVPVIDATDSNGSLTISDSTVQAGNWSDGALWGFNFTATRVDISGGQHSVHCNDNCTVVDSWLHDQYNAPGESYHNNAFISNGGSTMLVRHNTLHCTATLNDTGGGCTADLSLFGDFAPITKVTVENNLFKANDSSISFCAFGGHEPKKAFPDTTEVRFVDNVFERGTNGKCGVFGAATSFQAAGQGNLWSNNTFADGAPVEP